MGFDFLSDDANLILDICTRAERKKEEYLKTLNYKPRKKEMDEITERFVIEELQLIKASPKNKNRKTQICDAVDFFDDIDNEDDEFDDLELDEMMDVWDEDDL